MNAALVVALCAMTPIALPQRFTLDDIATARRYVSTPTRARAATLGNLGPSASEAAVDLVPALDEPHGNELRPGVYVIKDAPFPDLEAPRAETPKGFRPGGPRVVSQGGDAPRDVIGLGSGQPFESAGDGLRKIDSVRHAVPSVEAEALTKLLNRLCRLSDLFAAEPLDDLYVPRVPLRLDLLDAPAKLCPAELMRRQGGAAGRAHCEYPTLKGREVGPEGAKTTPPWASVRTGAVPPEWADPHGTPVKYGAPAAIRTRDLQIRSLTLYPG